LIDNQTITSIKLTTWGEYAEAASGNATHPEIEDSRLVWNIEIDCPKGFIQKAEHS
jgi:hypothetical protein